MDDPRDEILSDAYAVNAELCARMGHEYRPDVNLGGALVCVWCRAAAALQEAR